MSHSIFAAIILGLVIAADSSMAQPYGLNQSQPIFMLLYPGTNRLVMLHNPGTITTFPASG